MKLTLEMKMDNDAFVDDPREASRILREAADQIAGPTGLDFVSLTDINGNTVGHLKIEEDN